MFRTIVLGILTIATIAVAVIQTQDGALRRLLGRGAFSVGENLFSFSPQKADLLLVRTGDLESQFRKNDQGIWWGVTPWNDRMDPRAAESILQFTLGTQVVDTLPLNNTVKGNLREFGVTNSPTEVIVKDKNEHSLARYKLGNISPWIILNNDEGVTRTNALNLEKKFGAQKLYFLNYIGILPFLKDSVKDNYTPTTYLQSSFYQWMDNIFVTTGNISPLFKDGFRYLRDHRPLYFNPADIKAIEIKTDKDTLSLSRPDEKTPWLLTSPAPLKGDQAYISNLIGVLQKLTALRVYDPDEVTIQDKNSPQNRHITLSSFQNSPPVTLTIHPQEKASDDFVLATVSDRNAIFKLPINSVEGMPGIRNLALTQKLLRAKNLLDIDREALNAISLRSPQDDSSLIIKKIHKKWRISDHGGDFTPLNEEQVFQLLKTISLDPVADFATDNAIDLGTYGLDDPVHVLMFAFEDKSPLSVFIGKGVDGKFYAMVDDIPSVYILSSDYVHRLGLHSYQWKPLHLIQLGASELCGIIAEVPGSEKLVLEETDVFDKWKASIGGEETPYPVNINKLNNFIDRFLRMEVRLWLPSSDLAAREALKKPAFRITFVTKPSFLDEGLPDIITHTISLAPAGGNETSLIFYGQKEGESEYFTIGRDQLDLFIPDVFETDEDAR